MIEYALTLNSDQAKELRKAVELLMRLKINQPEEISRAVMPVDYWQDDKVNTAKFNDWINRRDRADEHFKAGFRELFPSWESMKKDSEWYRLYNLYQVIRYAIHEAEYPDSTGVDSRPPMSFRTDEPIPECTWKKTS